MSRALKIILIILLFIGFFEVGLFSSYTIVTSEVPDIQELIDFQIITISEFFNPEKVNEVLIKDPDKINITNKKDIALALENVSQVDGINIESMNITTYDEDCVRYYRIPSL